MTRKEENLKALPYFKWYPADAECDQNFRAMDDADIGFYIRCLNHAWINGSLPADPKERARVLRTRLDTANKRWVRVGKCFVNSTLYPEQLINLRQETERSLASLKSLKAAESVNHRYERNTNEALRALATESETESETDTKKETHTQIPCVRAALPSLRKPNADDLNGQTSPNFEQWFSIWAAVRGNAYRPHAFQAYVSTVLLARESDAMECAQSYVAGPGSDSSHGYRPDNFLYEMARDSFKTRWPTQQRAPERRETAIESAIRKAKEAKNGTR